MRSYAASARRGLPACHATPKNYHACEKSYALRVESIHHDSTCPGRLAASITAAPSARVAASPRSNAQTKPCMRAVNADGFRPLPVSSQADFSKGGSNDRQLDNCQLVHRLAAKAGLAPKCTRSKPLTPAFNASADHLKYSRNVFSVCSIRGRRDPLHDG